MPKARNHTNYVGFRISELDNRKLNLAIKKEGITTSEHLKNY